MIQNVSWDGTKMVVTLKPQIKDILSIVTSVIKTSTGEQRTFSMISLLSLLAPLKNHPY